MEKHLSGDAKEQVVFGNVGSSRLLRNDSKSARRVRPICSQGRKPLDLVSPSFPAPEGQHRNRYRFYKTIHRAILTSYLTLLLPLYSLAQSQESCIYIDNQGIIRHVNSRGDIPEEHAGKSNCFTTRKKTSAPQKSLDPPPHAPARNTQQSPIRFAPANPGTELADPNVIELKGSVRQESISTSLGTMRMRWPRLIEDLFGRTPVRAVADAARTAARALQSPGFPPHTRRLNADWEIVFLDENLPETQIPSYLINNCHPAWMLPPAKLYVVAQRSAQGCGGGKVSSAQADARLAQILLHEMGHAIEYSLVPKHFGAERMRAEGFAAWFEIFASKYSQLINSQAAFQEQRQRAQASYAMSPKGFRFGGSGEDYARAAFYFHAIEKKRQVFGIRSVYDLIEGQGLGFYSAVEQVAGWNAGKLDAQAAKIVLQK